MKTPVDSGALTPDQQRIQATGGENQADAEARRWICRSLQGRQLDESCRFGKQTKEKALAEAAALLVLQKKPTGEGLVKSRERTVWFKPGCVG